MEEGFFLGNSFIFEELHEEIARQRFQEEYAGYAVTDGFYILPAAVGRMAPAEFRHVICLDGYRAFGDGRHPTTRMCLHMMESFLGSMDAGTRRGLRLLDAGTGTGILAIAASMLGAGTVDAFDMDPGSVESARSNGEMNGLRGIGFRVSDIAGYAGGVSYDIVMANLLSDVLVGNAGSLAGFVRPGGTMIASGVSDMRRDGVLDVFTGLGFDVLHRMGEEGWNCFFMKKEDASF